MAFDVTSKEPTLVENVGINHSLIMVSGVVALSAGSKVVSIPGIDKVVYAHAESQGANGMTITATSGNTFTITGTGTQVAMWMALCIGKQ